MTYFSMSILVCVNKKYDSVAYKQRKFISHSSSYWEV